MKRIEKMKSLLLRLKCRVKTLLQVFKRGGESDLFNSSALLLLTIFNIVQTVLSKQSLLSTLPYTAPIIIFAILIYYKKTSKVTKSIMFIALGVIYHLNMLDPSGLGSTPFFILAFLQYKNKKHGLIICVISLITIIIRSTYSLDSPSQVIVTIFAFIFIYGNVYLIIKKYKSKIADLQKQLREKNKREPRLRNIDVINIKEEEKAIIKLHCSGMSYENISKYLGLNVIPNTVRRKIAKIMKENNIKNDAHFGHWVFKEV